MAAPKVYLAAVLLATFGLPASSTSGGAQTDGRPQARAAEPPVIGGARTAGRLQATAPGSPVIFSVAGAESIGARVLAADSSDVQSWIATDRRIDGDCLDRFSDGALLLCDSDQLLRLGVDGVMRPWPPGGLSSAGDVGVWLDAAVASDGSVVAVGSLRAVRIAPDGRTSVLIDFAEESSDGGVDVLSDGTAVIAEPGAGRVVRVAPSGARTVVASREASPRVTSAADVTALLDGSVAILEDETERVRVVTPAGTMRTVAGGGRGFAEGAAGTSVDLDQPTSVQALNDGALLITSRRGVLRLSAQGRISTVVRGTPGVEAGTTPVDPRAVTTDGRRAEKSLLMDTTRADALPSGELLVLTRVPAEERGVRLAQIVNPGQATRFGVALPGHDRALVRNGAVDVVATHAATADIHVVRRPRHVAARTRVTLNPGRTRVRLRVARSPDVHELRLRARTSDGRVATHRLTLIPAPVLSRRVLEKLSFYIDLSQIGGEFNFETRDCRRASGRRFTCRWVASGDVEGGAVTRGRSSFTLRTDGLVEYQQRQRQKKTSRELLDPLF